MSSTPTTIITGFLGSGKTTVISHLIDTLQAQGEKVAYIKNEIGDENIDGKIIAGKLISTRELLNGCICCTLVGPFIAAIDEIVDTIQPSRIIIEASGAADPSAIALMVSSNARLHRDGVITIIDVVNFEGYKDLSFTAREQAKFTDLIVFNKIELVSEDRLPTVVGYVRELNEWAPIVEAPQGVLDPEIAFGISTLRLEKDLAHSHHHHNHLKEDGIESITISLPPSVTEEEVQQHLAKLPKNVIRVKGYFTTPQGVKIVNRVGTRLLITDAPSAFSTESAGTLVFIGFAIDRLSASLAWPHHSESSDGSPTD